MKYKRVFVWGVHKTNPISGDSDNLKKWIINWHTLLLFFLSFQPSKYEKKNNVRLIKHAAKEENTIAGRIEVYTCNYFLVFTLLN